MAKVDEKRLYFFCVKLCKQSFAHFKPYLALEPNNGDLGKIRDAIESLMPRVDVLKKMAGANEQLEVLGRKSTTLSVVRNR